MGAFAVVRGQDQLTVGRGDALQELVVTGFAKTAGIAKQQKAQKN